MSPETFLTSESFDLRRGDVKDPSLAILDGNARSMKGLETDPVCPAPLHRHGGCLRIPWEPLKLGYKYERGREPVWAGPHMDSKGSWIQFKPDSPSF